MTRFKFQARFLLARITYIALGLPITHYLNKIQYLWGVSLSERRSHLDAMLSDTAPLSADGAKITSVKKLMSAPILTKQNLREQILRKKIFKKNYNRHTAGTTGKAVNIHLSRHELAQMLAVREYCFIASGIRLGDREARIWGRGDATIKTKIRDYLLNRRIFCPTGECGKNVVEELLLWKPTYLYGYSSLLMETAQIINKYKLNVPKIQAVVCTAESILPAQKKFLSYIFDAPVFEEYGSTEFDILAFECRSGHRHLVNPWLVVEDESGECLVSDTSRKTQNIIRYRIGDLVKLTSGNCSLLGDNLVFDEIQGRTANQFAYISKYRKVHVVELTNLIDEYMNIFKVYFGFTIIQNYYGVFDLIVTKEFDGSIKNFQCWLNNSINANFNVNVTLNISIGLDCQEMGSNKRSYFAQNISSI